MSCPVSLFIAGDYVDAYLYSDVLLVWDGAGRLAIVQTRALASAAIAGSDMHPQLARAAFVDNQLLDEVEVTGTENGDRSSAVADQAIQVNISDLSPRYFRVAPELEVLDLMATYGRLFVSTTDSLLSVPFDAREVGPTRKRLDHTCVSTLPRWGSVTASCANAGSWALLGENSSADVGGSRTLQFDSATSIRHSWLGSNVLTFEENGRFDPFRADVERGKGKETLVRGFEPLSSNDFANEGWWLDEDADIAGLSDSDFTAVFPGEIVTSHRGEILATPLHVWGGFPQPDGYSQSLGRVPGRILDIVRTAGEYVIETDGALHILTDEGREPELLLERETIALRSYGRSRRYRRVVTATADGGLLIAAFTGTPSGIRGE